MAISGSDRPRRLGIFGGAFNPPHYGHLRSALEVVELLGLDRLLFLPAGGHPFKRGSLIAGHHRLAMITLAVAGQAEFGVCDQEVRQPGTSYTVDTLQALGRLYPEAERYFVMGADLFQELHQWKSWQTLIQLAHLCVMVRPGYGHWLEESPAAAWLAPYRVEGPGERHGGPGFGWLVLPVTALGISSSDLRHRLATGGSIRFLTPDPVVGYIRQHRLYQPVTMDAE